MSYISSLTTTKCLICQSDQSEEIAEPGADGLRYSCHYCGEYTISRTAIACLDGNANIADEFKKKAPALAFEMNQKGETPFAIFSSADGRPIVNGGDFLSKYPDDFEEKIQRSLLNLFKVFKPHRLYRFDTNMIRLLFEDNPDDATAIINTLQDLGYIKASNWATPFFVMVTLTLLGWKTAKKINDHIASKNTAFIAMWFSDVTRDYREATKKAIEQAGYEPVIVDEVMHNDFIMDKVLNLINESRFIISDFSCIDETIIDGKVKNGVRGGVYYEAGYAKGLGREVIHTCNEDAFSKRLHFDIQQKSTIIWKNDAGKITTLGHDYIDYLKEHIIATIGKGQKK